MGTLKENFFTISTNARTDGQKKKKKKKGTPLLIPIQIIVEK